MSGAHHFQEIQKKWHPLCCVSHPKTIKNYINPLDRFPWLDRCPLAIGPLEGSSHKKALERRKKFNPLKGLEKGIKQEYLLQRPKRKISWTFHHLQDRVIRQEYHQYYKSLPSSLSKRDCLPESDFEDCVDTDEDWDSRNLLQMKCV